MCSDIGGIEVSRTEIDSQITQIHWMGEKEDAFGSTTLIALSKKGRVYRGDNDGASWTDLKSKLQTAKNSDLKKSYATALFQGGDDMTIYVVGPSGDLWYTSDQGNTWTYRNKLSGNNIGKIVVNPSNPTQFLVSATSTSCGSKVKPGYCITSLYYTNDGGATMKKVDSYVRNFFWGKNSKIFYESYINKTGNQPTYMDSWFINLVSTTDYGVSTNVESSHVAGAIMKFNTMFIVTKPTRTSTGFSLSVRRDYGEGQDTPVDLADVLEESRYTILSTSEDFIFLSIEHTSPNYGNLYVSDNNDTSYTLSLRRISRNIYGHNDFHELRGVEGVYLANQAQVVDSKTIALQSKITFDNGGVWQDISPPQNDVDGHPYSCTDCSLNLNFVGADEETDQPTYGHVYSKSRAVGLLMATGNVGSTLSSLVGDQNTYFSRDAGITWSEVARGSNSYDFGDHGGLILMADNLDDTTQLTFTWNQFLTSTNCTFVEEDEEPVRIIDVMALPNNTGTTFVIHGTSSDSKGDTIGVIYSVDFSGYNIRVCDNNTDYEVWQPQVPGWGDCILGQSRGYTRRKQDSVCFNPDEYEPVSNLNQPCPCTPEDFECDICFSPSELNPQQCVPDASAPGCRSGHFGHATNNACVNNIMYVTQGYRLVTGDKCDINAPGASNLLTKVPVACVSPSVDSGSSNTNGATKSGHTGAIVVSCLFVIILIAVVVVAIIQVRKHGSFKKAIEHISFFGKKSSDKPYGGVGFIRLDQSDEESLAEARELGDDDIKNMTSDD